MLKRSQTSLFTIISIALVIGISACSPNRQYLKNRLDSDNKRYDSFLFVMDLLEDRNVNIMVETGTDRYGYKHCSTDGCSTPIFAEWARDHNALFYTVDIDPVAIEESKKVTIPVNRFVQFITSDSLKFLENFQDKIDFLYLDSYDFDSNNPARSQEHHLKEIQNAYKNLHKNSIVLIDDSDLPHGGKAKLVIDFLKEKNWETAFNKYQIVLVPTDKSF